MTDSDIRAYWVYEMIGISIVMPLYNAEKYIKESLESVLKQSFEDFELICVNDASEDSTLHILQEYQRKDKRIRIICNEARSGAAGSRNKGMGAASGKYLAFLDGDDIFDEKMLEKAYTTIENKDADIAIFEYQHVPSASIYRRRQRMHGQEYRERYCQEPFSIQEYEAYEITNWATGPCNKLYRRAFVEEEALFFQDLPSANDIYFVSMALLLAKRIIVLDDDAVMLYARDHFESNRISSNRDAMCNYKALLKIGEELVKRDKFDQLSDFYYYRVFFSLKDGLVADKKEERARDFYSFLQREGIAVLCSLGGCVYNNVDEYVQSALRQFKEKSFKSGWYKEENALKLYLCKKSDKVINLYERFRIAGMKIAIWGAGENGKVLSAFCRQHDMDVTAVIDKSKDKQGSCLQGHIVFAPEEILDKVNVIIISARFIYREVVKEVGGRKIEVIDINQFLCLS